MSSTGAATGSTGASGSGASPAMRFGIMTTIIPPTMPLDSQSAATGMTGTNAAAAAAAGAGAAVEGADGASAEPAADPFDPAIFDEAHGRSRGTAPPGTPVEPGGLECANEVCKPLPELPAEAASAGVMVALCCTAEGECGSKGSGPMSTGDPEECHIIPDSDPQCPRLDLMGFEIASCCTADGRCGLNGERSMMGKPCGSLEEAMEMFGSFIELPAPSACEPGKGPPHSSSAPAPGSSTDPATTDAMTTAGAAGGGADTTGAAGGGATTSAMTGAAGDPGMSGAAGAGVMSGAAGAATP